MSGASSTRIATSRNGLGRAPRDGEAFVTVLRCTAKLLKRLRQPRKPVEPAPHGNPLGEWYADIDSWRRQPFVVMLNAATGALLVLPGNAAGLRRLHQAAMLQFAAVCGHFGLEGPAVDAELAGFDRGFDFAATRDRSLVSSLNQRKFEQWLDLEHSERSLAESAARDWDGLFAHPSLPRGNGRMSTYHRPLDLVRQRLAAATGSLRVPHPGSQLLH